MKSKLNIDFEVVKHLDFNKAVKPISIWLQKKDSSFKRRLGKRLFKRLIHSKLCTNKDPKDFLFFSEMKRNDYTSLFNSVYESIGDTEKAIVWVDKEEYSKIEDFALLDIYTNANCLWSQINASCQVDKYCLYLNICLMLVNLEIILRHAPKVVVFFADMQPIENLCSQYLNLTNEATTVTLQHGLYVEYNNLDTINVINYENQVSKYFLSWGKSTADLINKYNPETSTILCGKPLEYNMQVSNEHITVVFDQPIFDEENTKMYLLGVDFARKNNRKLKVRFHPYSNKDAFRKRFGEIVEEGEFTTATFYICHTSTVLVELMHIGKKVGIFKTTIPTLDYPSELKFNDSLSLERIFNNKDQINYLEISEDYITCSGSESKKLYNKSLMKILGNKK